MAERLGTPVTVVKAQIHAGGRGKGGGVKLAKSPDEAAVLAGQMLGMKLVTPQTGEEGRIVRRLLIEEGLDIKRELYSACWWTARSGAPVFMASEAGGMEIEEVAQGKSRSDSARDDSSGDRLSALSRAQAGVRPWAFRGDG